jgi:hypothetical protein
MTLRLPIAMVAAVVALGGCANTPPPAAADPDPSNTSTSFAEPDPSPVSVSCALVSAAIIQANLGLAVSEPSQTGNGSAISCDYRPVSGALTVVITFATGEDKDSFARGRRSLDNGGQPTSDVPGLVDEAYVSSTESGDTVTNRLAARKGSIVMTVAAAASVDAEKSLVTKVLGGAG